MYNIQNAKPLADATLKWMRSPLNLGGCGVDPDDKTYKAVEALLEKVVAETSATHPWPTISRQSIGEALIGKHKEKSGYRKVAEPDAVSNFLNSREQNLRASSYFQGLNFFPSIEVIGKRDKSFRLNPQPIPIETNAVHPDPKMETSGQEDSPHPATHSPTTEEQVSFGGQQELDKDIDTCPPSSDLVVYSAHSPRLNFAGRIRYGDGFLPVRSFRWAMSFAKTIFLILLCAIFASIAALSWWSGFEREPLKTIQFVVLAAVLIFSVWYTQLRPWDRLMTDRIQKMDDIWMKWSEYSCEIEMSVVNDRRQFRAVRYEATCSICGGTVRLAEGRREFHDRLVGRCRESPREHVYSFDRVTLTGHPLRQLKQGYLAH